MTINNNYFYKHQLKQSTRNIQSVVDKSDFSEELKQLPDDGLMTEKCRIVFMKF